MRVRRGLAGATVIVGVLALAGAACGDDGETTRTLGSRTFNDHGTTDARGKQALDLEADSFYFAPAFLRGSPGQKLTLHVENESDATHNFSVAALGIDTDVPAHGVVDVEVTFAEGGASLFFCKYHTGQGMNGELLVGDAAPQAVDAGSAGGTSGVSLSPY